MKKYNLHLISDSTCETVISVARAVITQFDGVSFDEHIWPMVRSQRIMERVVFEIEKAPGIIMYTMVDKELRDILKQNSVRLNLPCIAVLSKVFSELADYLKITSTPHPGRQHELDDEYFSRVHAVNFTIAHDDGQSTYDLNDADIVLVGPSRTSKSPTCVYLAHRGFKTANVPFVMGCKLPDNLDGLTDPLVVGLTISTDRLVQLRKNRLLSIEETRDFDYVDEDMVKQELLAARKLCLKNNWPIIDVTKRSVEETAATIIQLYQTRKHKYLN
jgi:regulator of PEP synthase PpsR (kinase-PPPase family)